MHVGSKKERVGEGGGGKQLVGKGGQLIFNMGLEWSEVCIMH